MPGGGELDHQADAVLVQFSTVRYTRAPPTSSLEGKKRAQPTYAAEAVPHLLRLDRLCDLSGVLLHARFACSSFVYLLNPLFTEA